MRLQLHISKSPPRIALWGIIVISMAFSNILLGDQDWDGDNGVGNMSFNNNWYGDSQPGWGTGNGSLTFHFNHGNSTSIYDDYSTNVSTNDILFATSWTGNVTWDGTSTYAINFNQRLENDSSYTLTIGSVKLSGADNGATHVDLNPVGGDIIINASNGFFENTSVPYQVNGNNAHTLTLNTALGVGATASSVTFTIEQNSNVVINAAEKWTGDTYVLAGKLQFGSNGSINSSSAIRIGPTSGSATAEVDLAAATGAITIANVIGAQTTGNGNATIASQNTTNSNALSGHVYLDKNLSITQASGGTLNITQAKGADTTTGNDIKNYTETFTPAANGAINHSGTIYNSTGSGSIVMNGTGVLTLSGANTYSGSTSVSAGTLLVSNSSGSGTGTGAVTVNGSGTVLGGTGIISSTVTLGNTTPGAVVNPGPTGTAGTVASVGTLTTGALTLTGSNVFHIDASGTLASNWDKLIANGVTLGTTSTLQLSIVSGLTFTPGTSYVLISNTSAGAISGTFNGVSQGGSVTSNGYNFIASYTGGDGNDFTLTEVPEPSTWVAGVLGVGGLGFYKQRRFARLLKRVT